MFTQIKRIWCYLFHQHLWVRNGHGWLIVIKCRRCKEIWATNIKDIGR